ncbi:hypothetical protein IGI04_028993, partial [Brassica rapa subsp. trilocularis]
MIGQPMIPHSFNIHHPSQAITQTHTCQRQAYTNEIHIKPNLVPKPHLGLNIVQPPAMKLSLKITGTCTQPYQHARIENMMHPSPSPSQTRSTLNSKWNSNKPTHSVLGEKLLVDRRGLGQNPRDALTGLDFDRPRQADLDSDRTFSSFWTNMTGLDELNWTELPRHNRRESPIGRNWPSRNELGSWGIYRRHQPISFRLVAARVSLRMAPDACTATPRAPHGWLHVQDTCRTPPFLPDVRLHDWSSCKAPQHHTHVDQHASVACVATSRAWLIHLVLLHVKLNVQLPCTATPRASLDTQLPPASSKNFVIPKLGFSPNFGFSRRASIPSCLLPVLLNSHIPRKLRDEETSVFKNVELLNCRASKNVMLPKHPSDQSNTFLTMVQQLM